LEGSIGEERVRKDVDIEGREMGMHKKAPKCNIFGNMGMSLGDTASVIHFSKTFHEQKLPCRIIRICLRTG